VGSTMDKGPPLIRFELRQRAFPQALGAQAPRVTSYNSCKSGRAGGPSAVE